MSEILRSVGAYRTGQEDSSALKAQGDAASDQGLADEQALRSDSRQFLGRQAAAFAENGIGTGGTTALLLRQSNVAANLDALTLRYKGQSERSARYGAATNASRRGKTEAAAHLLRFFEKRSAAADDGNTG